MVDDHRTNLLLTSCLRTPVDPQTKAPLASYERNEALRNTAATHRDNRMAYEELGSDFSDEDDEGKENGVTMKHHRGRGEHFDLNDLFFSNEEYYRKLEELKTAHLCTMAQLDTMYRQKLQLKSTEPAAAAPEAGHGPLWADAIPVTSCHLRKALSAAELRRSSDSSDRDDSVDSVEKGLLFSPKEHIKNMWQDFKVSPPCRRLSSTSLQNLADGRRSRPRKGARRKTEACRDGEPGLWKHRVTVPKPFQMTLRAAERRKLGIKTRSEVELENAELRRQLEELAECQRTFRASPVPAHVRLPLYEELQEQKEERRRVVREREAQHLRSTQKPFSFIERERLKKKEERRLDQPESSAQEEVKPFKAKPVPKAVYAAASGERVQEEQLYRSIKVQMRAQEMLHRASLPPSMLARRLSDRKTAKEGGAADGGFSHRPKINKEVPDFNAIHRRFQKHLESQKEARPTTTCRPFELRTSQIASRQDRILADMETERSSPRMVRWPYIGHAPVRTPTSSLCSSLSGSLELLPAKVTDATKKRHEAVRKVLEQRKKAEEEEERWKETRRRREKKLQRVVLRRAQANDPHLALSQTQRSKLKAFRDQDLERRKEYQQEIKEMQQRVKGRPLLLEQVAQRNAKQAAERRFADALHACDLTEEFISRKLLKSGSAHGGSKQSDHEDPDVGFQPVHFRTIFVDDEDESEEGSSRHCEGEDVDAQHSGEEDRHASDESSNSSDDGECNNGGSKRQEAAE